MAEPDDKKQTDASRYAELSKVVNAAREEGEMRATGGIAARVIKKRYFTPPANDKSGNNPEDKAR
jgi:hypothetical protein